MAPSTIAVTAMVMLVLGAQAKLHHKELRSSASASKGHVVQLDAEAAPAPSPATIPEADWGKEWAHAKDPSVLKWKSELAKETPSKLPAQGFEGKPVMHTNQKTVTKDWTHEYGPKGVGRTKPVYSLGVRSATTVFMVSAVPVFMVTLLMG
mmetsp:Transcript_46005/g.80861  ORF Transcript_46005/g.80861 Transcript_46005/m.80861 type:complete len:151 (+) Transcript_46005:102-554(+)